MPGFRQASLPVGRGTPGTSGGSDLQAQERRAGEATRNQRNSSFESRGVRSTERACKACWGLPLILQFKDLAP